MQQSIIVSKQHIRDAAAAGIIVSKQQSCSTAGMQHGIIVSKQQSCSTAGMRQGTIIVASKAHSDMQQGVIETSQQQCSRARA